MGHRVGVLKVNDENSVIQSQIRIHWSEARMIRGFGSVTKCYGSAKTAFTYLTQEDVMWATVLGS